jgi:hypothetical protein
MEEEFNGFGCNGKNKVTPLTLHMTTCVKLIIMFGKAANPNKTTTDYVRHGDSSIL